MGIRTGTRMLLGLLGVLLAGATAALPAGANDGRGARPETVRFATFNASLNRFSEGALLVDLAEPYDPGDHVPGRWQAANVAEVIQRTRPEVLLLNEFDYDPAAVTAFQENYLSVPQGGAEAIEYPYVFIAESNTGMPSGFDLDANGTVGGPGDAFGFGFFPGQYGMVVLSQHPIDADGARTFQDFLWRDLPGNVIPEGYYGDDELEVFRLSSKSHWDVPIEIGSRTVHFLVSHPTPPVFDGPEDRNGTRNHDEIRFWADYVDPAAGSYIYDDEGRSGGLHPGARFVIAGDQNADPLDGDSIPGAIQQLTEHARIRDVAPTSDGAVEASDLQGGANETHRSDPAADTADFGDGAPGNLRVDYVLPARPLGVADSGVFWPVLDDPLSRLTGVFDRSLGTSSGFPTSDHRLVWVDLVVR